MTALHASRDLISFYFILFYFILGRSLRFQISRKLESDLGFWNPILNFSISDAESAGIRAHFRINSTSEIEKVSIGFQKPRSDSDFPEIWNHKDRPNLILFPFILFYSVFFSYVGCTSMQNKNNNKWYSKFDFIELKI